MKKEMKQNEWKGSRYKIDEDYYDVAKPRWKEERKRALEAKFSQNLDCREVLLQTKRAKLVHFKRGVEPEADILLMECRDNIL
jgi:hypothetical protein